jgi:hypothetical protein
LHFLQGMDNLACPPIHLKPVYMAIVKGNNPIIMGISGILADTLVFYQRGGKQLVRKRPAPRRFTSKAQRHRQQRFKEAVRYAKNCMLEPELISAMTDKLEPGKSVFHAFISEYMRTVGTQ